MKSPEAKAWLANKNYADVDVLAQSAMSSEKLIGADKAGRTVVLPKDEKDEAGRKEFYAKIGVPETADGYKLPLPEGDDGAFAKTASTWFHKHGVPAKAAEGIASEWNGFLAEQVKANKEAEQQKSELALNSLRVEWGHEFDMKAELGRRGLREVGKKAGLEDADLAGLESTLGTAKMLKLFSEIGAFTGEAGFAGGGGSGGFNLDKSAAQTQLNQIITDRAAGKINDHQWRTEFEPKQKQLIDILTRA